MVSPISQNGLYRPFRANYAAQGLLLRRRLLRSLELDVAPLAHGDLLDRLPSLELGCAIAR